MARLRDLMMNMYNSDEEDDYDDDDHGDEEGRVEIGGRAAVPAPPQPADQRGEIYDDLLESVQLVSNCSVRVIELLEKCGAVEDCERVGNLVNRLAKLDEDLDKDRRVVDQTWREHGTDLSEELALEKYFKNIRKDIILERPGRNRELFDGMKEKLAQIPEKIADRENGQNGQQNRKRGRAGNVAADDEADESIEMEMLTQFMSDKDPITKARINEPVKNSICGHVYDRDSIRVYIRFNKERRQLQQCPVEMCRNKRNIEMEHLLPFPEFFQLVRRARSRSRSRQGRSRSRSRPRISTPQRRSNHLGTPSNGQGPSTSSAGKC